ncbi:MAG TPA: S8 family serine peptidase [Galbitalea sp.]|jgi:hypothetical protein
MALVAGMMSAAPANAISRLHPNPTKAHSLFTKLAAESRASAKSYKAGQYIVRLKASPASTYTGGVHGFVATKPAPGKQLDAKVTAVKLYSAHLKSAQNTITSHYGVRPMYNYTLAFNGFSANLSAKQANDLAKNSSVSTLVRSQKLKVQADPIDTPPVNDLSSIRYLNIDTGVWAKNGGPANAGKGVVLGDIDTGIAPENPSFAGSRLRTAVKAGTTPAIIDGGGVDTVQFKKADGNVFSSSIIPNDPADGWTSADLSTKIIAAHYFVKGFGTSNLGSTGARGEYISPRDGAGHGSHTASTAAGDYSVSENVSGTDFGKISGVAPAAKIAVYKVCWDGPALDESQDGCDTSDMVAAIDQAVQDGVDVLNFSIGGSSGAATTFSPTDEAFYNAASAGIFIAAAGGNAGPADSTLDNASPWETTVAASTIPSYTATATFGAGGPAPIQGASNDVGYGSLPQVPNGSSLVDSKDFAAGGSTSAIAGLCGPDSLSAGVAGKVVLCDRGTYDRVAKSAEVKRAGGIGMLLVNTPGGAADTDLDLHTVPSIHINASNSTNATTVAHAYAALHAYAHLSTATVSFAKSSDTSPVPQIAGFSSHGPVLADGSDIMKPDVSAPGVSILAAVANGPAGSATAAPKWNFYSGTSMATPHVAGLALLYLAVHPLASVSEIQSALMTTATNTVDSEGKAVTDPFAQGAGEVKPSAYLNPGLLFLSKQSDWNNYLYSVGEVTHADAGFSSAVKIDPSNLNRASIAIGDFFGTQKVTRTVTAQSKGTYRPSVSVKGVKASVSPSSVRFTKVGQAKTFTITFTRTSAPLDEWTSGFMTFRKSSSTTTVRLPIAIHPTSLQAPAEVDGVGVRGSAPIPLTAGAKLTVGVIPYIAGSQVETPKTAPDGSTYSDTAVQGGHAVYQDVVTGAGPCGEGGCANAGSEFLRWNAQPVPARGADTDLDLYVAYYGPDETVPTDPSIDDLVPNLIGESATSANDETVSYFPTEAQYEDGGTYVAYVDYFATPEDGANFAESFTNLTDDSIDPTKLDTTPDFFSMVAGQKKTLTAKWAGLESNADYSGILFFVNPETFATYNATFMDINTSVPVVKTKPTITGTAKVGQALTAHSGTFDSTGGDKTYQWLSGGTPIGGATSPTYVVGTADVGHALSVVETYSVDGGTAVTATSAATAVVKLDTTTSFTIVDSTITTKQHAELKVTVALKAGETLPHGASITGTLTVKSGTTTLKFTSAPTVHGGVAEFLLQKFEKGTKSITVTFNGSSILNTSKSAAHSIKVS